MISNIDSNYKSICKLFNFSKESACDINKKILLEMAKDKKERPKQKTNLGNCLSDFTCKSNYKYDPVFDKQIKKLRPDWFYWPESNKKTLLEMATKGENRPSQKTKSGLALSIYTNKSSSYDPVFDKKIRKLRPDWFVTQSEKANEKKLELIRIAKNGENRPKKKTKLGSLVDYTCKTSGVYDPVFDKQIRELRPDWFVTVSEKANEKKLELIRIAKNGENRPKQKTKEANALCRYTTKGTSYDESFDKLIRKLRPDWFKNPTPLPIN